MKKFFKALALVLALTLVLGTVPASAATTIKAVEKKTLYVGGTKGVDNNGNQSKYKARVTYAKLLGITKKEAKSLKVTGQSTDDAIVKASDKTRAIRAYGMGDVTITLKVGKDTYKVAVTAKKSADEVVFGRDWANVTGTFEAEADKEYTVSVPRSKAGEKLDTDERRLVCDDESVVITPVEGKDRLYTVKFTKAGTYTVKGEAFQSKKSYPGATATAAVEVTVKGADFAAKVIDFNKIQVEGTNFTKDTKFTVKRGSTESKVTVELESATSAVLTVDPRLSAGTYTVSDGTYTVDVAVEDEKVADILILEAEDNKKATTNANRTQVFVHYDVINQYGYSCRDRVTISWTTTFGNVTDNRKLGLLTLTGKIPAGGTQETVNYAVPITILGIYNGFGNVVSKSESITVGLERSVGTVDFVGIYDRVNKKKLEKNEVPAGFKANDYSIIFQMRDNEGYAMEYKKVYADAAVFTSLTPLMFEVGTAWSGETAIIDGVEYPLLQITKVGLYAKDGGKATISAVGSKTGGQTTLDIDVVTAYVVETFKFLAPKTANGLVIDWEDNEIGFEALTADGKSITKFRDLYDQVILSTTGLRLEEQKDGSAKLIYRPRKGAAASEITDAIEMLIATVPRTGSHSEMQLAVKERAYSAEVKGIDKEEYLYVVSGGTRNLVNNDFKYYDQYGRERNDFEVGNRAGLRVVYSLVSNTVDPRDISRWGLYGYRNNIDDPINMSTDRLNLQGTVFTSGSAKFVVKATIWQGTTERAGSEKSFEFTTVAIDQFSSFTVSGGSRNKIADNGDDFSVIKEELLNEGSTDADTYTAEVKGKLANGIELVIPNVYVEYAADGGSSDYDGTTNPVTATGIAVTRAALNASAFVLNPATNYQLKSWAVGNAANTTLKLSQFKNYSSPASNGFYPFKDVVVNVTAKVYKADTVTRGGAAVGSIDPQYGLAGAARNTIKFGAEVRRVASLGAMNGEVRARNGYLDMNGFYKIYKDYKNDNIATYPQGYFKCTDNYGKVILVDARDIEVEISEYKEDATGYYDTIYHDSAYEKIWGEALPHMIAGNGSSDVELYFAEIGDKFNITFTYKNNKNIKATGEVTVINDELAYVGDGRSADECYFR